MNEQDHGAVASPAKAQVMAVDGDVFKGRRTIDPVDLIRWDRDQTIALNAGG
jgi:hypothetical protein